MKAPLFGHGDLILVIGFLVSSSLISAGERETVLGFFLSPLCVALYHVSYVDFCLFASFQWSTFSHSAITESFP